MSNNDRSPSKNNSKSATSLPRSHHKLIHSPKTASKVHSEIKKQIFHSQAYKTILSKLLSKNNIEQFMYEVFKFGIINDEFSIPYVKKQFLAKSPTFDFPELGKSFLRDGSFLKHYCYLLMLKQPHQSQVIKKRFYNKYKEEAIEKKAYFERFFKAQIKEQNDHTLQAKLQTSRKNIAYSLKKTALSLKKAVTEKIQMSQKLEKRLESISAIDPTQSKQYTIVPQNDYSLNGVRIKQKQLSQRSFKKTLKQRQAKTPDKNKDILDSQELTYVSCRSKNKKYENQTESQRQKRLLGLVTSRQKVSEKKQTNIIKFVDSISSNRRLKEIYQSIKKEKQIQNSQSKINSNTKTQLELSPVFRSNYSRLKIQIQSKTLKQLTAQLIEKISCSERSLLKYFPNITKIGFKNKIQKDSPIILGQYREKILMKSFVIDYNSCIQPTLIAVYFQPLTPIKSKHLCYFNKQIDKDVDVLLVEQFSTQNR